MRLDGVETLAKWREAGEWWNGGSPREVHRFIDPKGIRREVVQDLKSNPEGEKSEVRIRRLRDEKVRKAMVGCLPPKYGNPRQVRHPGVLLHAQSAYALSRGTILAGELAAFAGVIVSSG